MCVQLYKIKSSSPHGQKFAFIPCGKCEECRDSMRNQWFFRLRTELDWCHKHKFHIGFFTLTYSEDKIPRVPVHLIGNKELITTEHYDEKGVLHRVCNHAVAPYCFSRSDVRTFIDTIRKRVFEIVGKKQSKLDDKRIRYMICSEYGSDPERTQRSHYHGLICFPPEVKPEVMFDLIHRLWRDKGFVYPRDIRGGKDRHGYVHQPFLLSGDVSRAARYASKYCTKDLNFSAHLMPYDVDRSHPDWKDCKCFHIQSKSIGLGILSQLPADKLLDILKNGVSYVGDSRRRSLPLYIKNKILYNPWYVFESSPVGDWYYDFEADKWRYSKSKGTHKRLVRREASAFFYKHRAQIYEMKVQYYTQLFKDMQQYAFWKSRVNDCRLAGARRDELIDMCSTTAGILSRHNSEKIARGYLSYYGRPYDKCYFVNPVDAWFSRYEKKVFLESFDEYEPWIDSVPLVNRAFYDTIQECVGSAVDCLRFCEFTDYAKRERVAKVSDFYKHAI